MIKGKIFSNPSKSIKILRKLTKVAWKGLQFFTCGALEPQKSIENIDFWSEVEKNVAKKYNKNTVPLLPFLSMFRRLGDPISNPVGVFRDSENVFENQLKNIINNSRTERAR